MKNEHMAGKDKPKGMRKGLTRYGDDAFALFLRKSFIKGAGYVYPAKQADGMFSNEEEYVKFAETFHAAGAVENYLCDLER